MYIYPAAPVMFAPVGLDVAVKVLANKPRFAIVPSVLPSMTWGSGILADIVLSVFGVPKKV